MTLISLAACSDCLSEICLLLISLYFLKEHIYICVGVNMPLLRVVRGQLLSYLVNPGLEHGSSGWALPAEHLSGYLYVLYILYAFWGRGLRQVFSQSAPEFAILHPQLPSADHTWLPHLFVTMGDLGRDGRRKVFW